MRRHTGERGSVSLEAAVLAPGLLAVLAAVIAGGRITIAHGTVQAAARDAARQASIARTPATARRQATASADATLTASDLHCTRRHITVTTTGYAVPVGRAATVTATVTCTVDLADIAAPGLPGATTLTADFTSPLDTYRTRGDAAASDQATR